MRTQALPGQALGLPGVRLTSREAASTSIPVHLDSKHEVSTGADHAKQKMQSGGCLRATENLRLRMLFTWCSPPPEEYDPKTRKRAECLGERLGEHLENHLGETLGQHLGEHLS